MALVSPALLVIAIFFVFPLLASVVSAFQAKTGEWTLANFDKSFELYSGDVGYTVVIVAISTAVVGLLSVAIGGYLTLGTNPRAQAVLRWLYRWPLFIPFIVAGQVMRTFLAKNGLLNQLLIGSGILEPLAAQSYLDWRGIVLAFVWKQTPFVALMVAGAMAAIDPAHIEAARNLGAGRLRILFGIIIPQDPPHADGRPRALLRDHALGALGAADDQPEQPDDDDGRRRVPDQRARRLRRGQCAVPDLAGAGLGLGLGSICGTAWPGRVSSERACSHPDGCAMSTAAGVRAARDERRRPRRNARRPHRQDAAARRAARPVRVLHLRSAPQPAAVGVRQCWYFPNKLPSQYGFSFWSAFSIRAAMRWPRG